MGLIEALSDPRSKVYGGMVMFTLCWFTVGNYFSYDSMGAIESPIRKEFRIDGVEFGLSYSVYAFPNTVMPLLMGMLLSNIGMRTGAVVMVFISWLGTSLVALAPALRSYYTLLLGRFIFGIGGEGALVAQNNICVQWFQKSGNLAVAMGLATALSRLGTVMVFNVLPEITEATNVVTALWFCAFCVFSSFMAVVAYFFLDRRAERIAPDLRLPMQEKPFELREIGSFNTSFWLMALLGAFFYATIFPFSAISSFFFEARFGYSTEYASRVTSVLILISMICSTPLGYLTDRYYKYAPHFVLGGCALLIPAFFVLGFTHTNPIAPMMLIGAAFSLVPSAIWPCVGAVVEPHQASTAFGLIIASQNTSLFLSNFAAGFVVEHTGSDEMLCLYFIGLSVMALLFAVAWVIVDTRHPDHRRNRTKNDRSDYQRPGFAYYNQDGGLRPADDDLDAAAVLTEAQLGD